MIVFLIYSQIYIYIHVYVYNFFFVSNRFCLTACVHCLFVSCNYDCAMDCLGVPNQDNPRQKRNSHKQTQTTNTEETQYAKEEADDNAKAQFRSRGSKARTSHTQSIEHHKLGLFVVPFLSCVCIGACMMMWLCV